ncbi:hypothetical protein Pmani_015534 [Petrolisthes manimaculis]|uniref:Uncharacterized protein n=1 Tax=Petrolisthes manimaculis TaxID=1843537 RepID=A0AAE1PRG3_9EUCA|nr:hypothetical protein Pmani_015534 [Petrolisthes manimaculis]
MFPVHATRTATYKAPMPRLDSEAEDEEAGSTLAKYIVTLLSKSKQLAVFHAHHHAHTAHNYIHNTQPHIATADHHPIQYYAAQEHHEHHDDNDDDNATQTSHQYSHISSSNAHFTPNMKKDEHAHASHPAHGDDNPGHDFTHTDTINNPAHTDTTHKQAHSSQEGRRGQVWLQRLLHVVPGTKPSHPPVFLPEDFISRVVRDVVRMAEGEQHGIRGCTLVLEACEGNRSVMIGKIVCDPRLATDYTITLKITLAPPPPHHTHRLLSKGVEGIYIGPGYTIEKTHHQSHTT